MLAKRSGKGVPGNTGSRPSQIQLAMQDSIKRFTIRSVKTISFPFLYNFIFLIFQLNFLLYIFCGFLSFFNRNNRSNYTTIPYPALFFGKFDWKVAKDAAYVANYGAHVVNCGA